MFNSVAFDVVIGLIFIYLLYSLLASVLSEIIATTISLRARNLKQSIGRMLTDEPNASNLQRFRNSLAILRNPQDKVVKYFYNHPEIKYLGSTGLFKDPSSLPAVSFSKTLMYILLEDELEDGMDAAPTPAVQPVTDPASAPVVNLSVESPQIEAAPLQPAAALAKEEIITAKLNLDPKKSGLGPETAKYLKLLWEESGQQIPAFKTALERWFDRTGEQATEWYKRKIQAILLVIGFCIAWFFNADTFQIARKLSHDKDARDKLVSMANAAVKEKKGIVAEVGDSKAVAPLTPAQKQQRLDSLNEIRMILNKDIADANSILGSGAWLPDRVTVEWNSVAKRFICTPNVEGNLIPGFYPKLKKGLHAKKPTNVVGNFSFFDKVTYFWRVLFNHFLGFLVTAIAISLGAPFWFDLLNKLMKLRTSTKQEDSNKTVPDPVTGKP